MVEKLLNLLDFLDWEKKKIEAQRDLVYRLEVKFKFIKKKIRPAGFEPAT